MKQLLFFAFLALSLGSITAQDAQEIVNNYFEVTGGKANWENLQSIKFTGYIAQNGMEIPIEVVQDKSGKSLFQMTIQGVTLYDNVFDGETLWGSNFMTMEAEKKDDEALANYKSNNAKDFPSSLLDYEEKGYELEWIGEEKMDGVACHKLKLTKKPIVQGGDERPNYEFYFFDKDSGILLATESTDPSGQLPDDGIIRTLMSDYNEVDGLYFPFAMSSTFQGQTLYNMNIDKIVTNAEIDDAIFSFPTK